MGNTDKNINELDDLLRKHFLADEDTYNENSRLIESNVLNEMVEEAPFYHQGEELVKKLERDFIKENKTRIKVLNSWLAYAAAVIVVLGTILTISLLNQNKPEEAMVIATGPDNKSHFYLPDSTSVWLNKNSSLTFLKSFKKRSVKLEGEAFFDVTKLKGKKFTIETQGIKTTVLGTSFNLSSTDKGINLVVVEGKVKMQGGSKSSQEIILTQGERGVYENMVDKLYSTPNMDDNFLAWKTEKLMFNGVNMLQVIETLSTHYNKNIIINEKNIGDCLIMTTFDNQRFEDVLNELKLILNIEYNFQGNKVIITGDGC